MTEPNLSDPWEGHPSPLRLRGTADPSFDLTGDVDSAYRNHEAQFPLPDEYCLTDSTQELPSGYS